MKLRHLLLASLITLSACSFGDKYPYAPQFVSTVDVPPTAIAAPPARGSVAYMAALDSVVARQKKLTAHDLIVLQNEDHIRPEMMVTAVLGKNVSPEKFPELYDHLEHVASDAWRIGDSVQDHYGSPRPWYAAPDRVKIHVGHIARPGYPSGHTTTNTVWAYVLGNALPCKQPALLARAHAIGYHRVDAGAHFPFDVEGGKKLGKIIYSAMVKSPDYQAEHAKMRAELAAAKVTCPTPTLH